jgi:GNAT superfamily N-acetyltransferase
MQIRTVTIRECKTQKDIESTYSIMKQLRPQLTPENYYSDVSSLITEEKYRLFAAYDDENHCLGVVGFQQQNRLSLGKIIYIADLVIDEKYRSQGVGARLLEFVKQEAGRLNVDAIVLDSGLQRKQAHEFYMKQGYKAESYSFRRFKPFSSINNEGG